MVWLNRATHVAVTILICVCLNQFLESYVVVQAFNPGKEVSYTQFKQGEQPSTELLQKLLVTCSDPCVVRLGPGGNVLLHYQTARAIKNERMRDHLVIDGMCNSGCVLTADLARPYVCITDRALFQVHQGVNPDNGRPFIPPHSRDILIYFLTHGGFPLKGYQAMPIEDARAFWPSCKDYHPPSS